MSVDSVAGYLHSACHRAVVADTVAADGLAYIGSVCFVAYSIGCFVGQEGFAAC